MKDRIAAEQTYQSLIEQYHNVEGAQEAINDATQELQSMGARIPQPETDSGTAYDRAQERRLKRRERDRPRAGLNSVLQWAMTHTGTPVRYNPRTGHKGIRKPLGRWRPRTVRTERRRNANDD